MKSLARFWTNEHYLQATLVAPRSKEWVCGLSHSGNVGSNPAGAWMSVSCECCVLSGTGLCDGPIPRTEEPYGMCVRASLSVVRFYNNTLQLQRLGRGGQTKRDKRKNITFFRCVTPCGVADIH